MAASTLNVQHLGYREIKLTASPERVAKRVQHVLTEQCGNMLREMLFILQITSIKEQFGENEPSKVICCGNFNLPGDVNGD